MVLTCLMQNIDMCLLYKYHQIERWVSHLIYHFSKWMFTVWQENATKFGSKNEILHNFSYHWVTSEGYIIVDSYIISFNLNCIMQLKQFYNIATKVSTKNATTFGDLPDCSLFFLQVQLLIDQHWSASVQVMRPCIARPSAMVLTRHNTHITVSWPLPLIPGVLHLQVISGIDYVG